MKQQLQKQEQQQQQQQLWLAASGFMFALSHFKSNIKNIQKSFVIQAKQKFQVRGAALPSPPTSFPLPLIVHSSSYYASKCVYICVCVCRNFHFHSWRRCHRRETGSDILSPLSPVFRLQLPPPLGSSSFCNLKILFA